MTIKVKFFASLAETVGCRETECAHVDGITIEQVWQQVTGNDGLPEGVLCAVDHEYCVAGQVIQDNEEVAYFPHVTGG